MTAAAQVWRYRARQFVFVVLALLLLDAAVTVHNVWPTLGVKWSGEVSVELAVLVLFLALTNAWLGATPGALLALLSAITVLFVLGRYADVTVPALYGREINLFSGCPAVRGRDRDAGARGLPVAGGRAPRGCHRRAGAAVPAGPLVVGTGR